MSATSPADGRTVERRVTITPADATRYARTLGDDASERFGIASPLLVLALARDAFAELMLSLLGAGMIEDQPGMVHLVRDAVFERPSLPGDALDIAITASAHRVHMGGGLLEFITTFTGDEGVRVRVRDVAQIIGGGPLAEFGDSPPVIDLDRARALARAGEIAVPDSICAAWADAVGDHQSIHLNDEVAQAFGFAKAIVHGSYTIAAGVAHVVREFGGDDPRRVRQVACRFAKPVYPGDRLRVEARSDDDRIAFRMSARGRSVVRDAFVDLVPEPG